MQLASKLTGTHALPARLPKGAELDGYVVDGWLRDGGMAAIYRAHRAADGARVALKLQLPSTAQVPEICARFDREAEAMRRVAHEPHVVELHHAGILDDGRRYFVMEWVEGDNLEEVLDTLRNQDQRLLVADACEIGLAIATGLAALHEHGLVHRDLKPANVMVARDEHDDLHVTLVDFGIVAEVKPEAGGTAKSHADEPVMGTSAYMAPEQIAGGSPTPAMDVFALGVVLYEALTGSCVPPDGWTPETLPTIDSMRRNVPPELSALVRACMSSTAAQRPSSGTAVAQRLGAIAERLQGAAPLRASEEIPIRTGSTRLTPRSQVVAREESVVRTGGTEVALTHEQVLTISSMGPVLPPPAALESGRPRHPSSSGSMPSLVAASERDAAVDGDRPPRRWWLALVVLVPLVAGGVWALGRGNQGDAGGAGDGGGAHGGASTAAAPPVAAPPAAGPEASSHASKGGEPDPSPAPHVVPTPAEPNGASDSPAGEDERDAAPAIAPEPDDAPDAATPAASALPASNKAPRPKGPDKAACEKLRAEAMAAKARRHWTGVLEATKSTACWTGAAFKLDRRRLRVEAYAETANYGRCVKEGGGSPDSQIVARVNWCSKKLGTGAGAGG